MLQLLQMAADICCHTKHADLLFAPENGLQLVVSIDHGYLLLILQSLFLDIGPEFLGNL